MLQERVVFHIVEAFRSQRKDVHDIHAEGQTVEFLHDGDSQSEADMLRELVLAGFRVVAFGSREKSLEDVFMQVTEGLLQ